MPGISSARPTGDAFLSAKRLRVFVRAGGARLPFLASGMTDRVYRCD
jgi:hypothetical protein